MRTLRFFMASFHFKFAVFLFMLLFLELLLINCVAVRCLKAENSALIQLKKGFTSGNLESWLPGTNCCIWEGVTCDESGRITGLELSGRSITGTINPSLFNLTSLDTLDFSHNNFDGIPIPDSGWNRLVNLSRLDLYDAGFIGKVPASISHLTKLTHIDLSYNLNLSMAINPIVWQNMSNLKYLVLDSVNVLTHRDDWCRVQVNFTPLLETLSMKNCSLFGAICSSLGMLPFLSVIDLGNNNLDSSILHSFANFSSLSMLDLRGNNFKGFFPNQIFHLRNLEYLDISYNSMLSGYLLGFPEYSNLKKLFLYNTNFSGNLPDSIGNLKFLTYLDLSSCRFYGTMPSSIMNLSKLESLDLSYNNFNEVVGLEFIKDLKNLFELDLSNSGFYLTQNVDIRSSSSSFPKMSILNIVGCNLTKIPTFIKYQDQMTHLDLSNNRIHGKIPSWLQTFGDKKMFTPFFPFNTTSQSILFFFSLADNNLTGEIPPFLCNLIGLEVLDLSNNKLTGTIPSCLLEKGINLFFLNLGGNKLHGTIPHEISPKCELNVINLRDNKLEGLLPRSLSNCPLIVLDLGNNNLKDTFPYWLGNMSWLRILVLTSNRFYGFVEPPDGSHEINYAFPMMHVLDISSNNFSGYLSTKCFSSFKSMMINKAEGIYDLFNYSFIYKVTIMNKGQLMKLQTYALSAKLIDFSNNHFEGEIPSAIGQLVSLQILNMSQNYLKGEIPPELGNLVWLESLDLSRNNLSGKIPLEFVSLHFISYLNLSYNKLVGTVPQGAQLCSFSNTSFEGNEGLHWFSCNTSVLAMNNTTTSPSSLGGISPNNKSYMIVLGILFGVGFGGSMAVVVVLDVIFCDKGKRRSRRPSHE